MDPYMTAPTDRLTTAQMIKALESGSDAARADRHRRGNVIELSGPGRVIMTGDLHGNERNFDRLVQYADLENHPDTHLVIHELLHSSSDAAQGQCHSYILVARAAALKAAYPDQVHYLLGNHAVAQVCRDEVIKAGQPMVRALNSGLFSAFGTSAGYVIKALDDFLLSLPLAVRTSNGIWMSHSLPAVRSLATFDDRIFIAPLTRNEFRSDPSLRGLLWDRRQGASVLAELCSRWAIRFFIVGHQPQADGVAMESECSIILASDHNRGCYADFDLSVSYDFGGLCDCVGRIARLAMSN
jgi:calcineurin-like phosphoesterase family protein